MPQMTGGDAVVASLQAEGVSTVFGIPGTYNLAIYDALLNAPEIKHILSRHEGGAAMMADGYARIRRRPGVCLTIGGPGATNALTGLVTARTESSPILMITTEIDQALIGLDRGVSHEIRSQLGIFSAALDFAQRADSVSSIPPAIHNAFCAMRSGRPRPAYVEVPWDLLGSRGEASICTDTAHAPRRAEDAQIDAAIVLLAQAERPLIFCGVGVHRAGVDQQVRQLAEALDCPVMTTAGGKGAIPEDHLLALGAGVGRNPVLTELFEDADVILAIGTSFDAWSMMGWSLHPRGKIIRLDVAAEQLQMNYGAAVELHGDAVVVLEQLLAMGLKRSTRHTPNAKSRADAARKTVNSNAHVGARFVNALHRALPPETILSVDLTAAMQWIAWNYQVRVPNSLLLPWNSATLGFGLPAAIGAKIAAPERPVVAIAGDGGFLFTAQELATVAQLQLPLAIIVVDNRAHGAIKLQQIKHFAGRYHAVDLGETDFVALAKSFAISAERVSSLDELVPALTKALKSGGPHLIEVPVELNALAHPWVQL